MMDSIGGKILHDSDGIDLFLEMTNARAEILRQYHEETGTGRTQVRRIFMYWNKREIDRIMKVYLRALSENP